MDRADEGLAIPRDSPQLRPHSYAETEPLALRMAAHAATDPMCSQLFAARAWAESREHAAWLFGLQARRVAVSLLFCGLPNRLQASVPQAADRSHSAKAALFRAWRRHSATRAAVYQLQLAWLEATAIACWNALQK